MAQCDRTVHTLAGCLYTIVMQSYAACFTAFMQSPPSVIDRRDSLVSLVLAVADLGREQRQYMQTQCKSSVFFTAILHNSRASCGGAGALFNPT